MILISKHTSNLFLRLLLLCIPVSFLLSCSSDSADDLPEPVEVDLNQARLTDFPLNEIEYVDIDIVHPEIQNGQETSRGTITITLPFTQVLRNYSLESVNFDLSKFEINPAVGEQRLFSENIPVVYTITSLEDAEKSIHYEVNVVISPPEQLKLVDFSFLAANNAQLPSDVNALKIVQNPGQSSDSLVYIMLSSPVDFSQLTPTVGFEGAKLEYRLNNQDYEEYPATGLSIDFKYPNFVYFRISDQTNTRSQVYQIITDVLNPIKFESSELVINDIKADSSYFLEGVIRWEHQGNYPIRPLTASSYTNITTPIAGFERNIARVFFSGKW